MPDLEQRVAESNNPEPNKKTEHSDKYHINKAILFGQIAGFGGFVAGSHFASKQTTSEEYISMGAAIGHWISFHGVYVPIAYYYLRNRFDNVQGLAMYLTKVGLSMVPAGICYNAMAVGGLYGLQKAGIEPELSAVISYTLATGVFIGVTNGVMKLFGVKTDKQTNRTDKCAQ